MHGIIIPGAPSPQEMRHDFVGVKGDLRVELHYADVKDGHGEQACLFIHHFRRPREGVLVPFSKMWRVAQADALDTVIRPLAKHLYGFVTRDDEMRVLDACMDYLEDLKNHKPALGRDKGIDDFLQECDDQGLEFFLEDGMGRRLSLT